MKKVVKMRKMKGLLFGMVLASQALLLGESVQASNELPTEYTPDTPENEGIQLIGEIEGNMPVETEENDYDDYVKYLKLIGFAGVIATGASIAVLTKKRFNNHK